MDNLILYDGLYQAEVDEFAYAEAELVVASNYIDNLFFDLVRGFNDDAVLYGEADDDGAKQGFFKRIWAMFKKFWKAIIDFIKNVCRKVLEILAKPFGFKMNKANNSGGAGSGGGSSTRTEGSSSSNSPIDKGEGWTVLKELGHLLNSTIAYIKTPHDISREKISTVDGVNLPSLYNQSSIDTYDAFERFLGNDKVSGTGLKNVLSNIIEETKNLKFFDNKNSLESINPKSLNMMGFAGTSYYDKAKVHSNISVKFEVPTADKEDDLKSLIAILNSATKVIENTMSCGSRTLSSLENLDKAANDKEVSDELAKLYSNLLSPSHMNNYSQGVDNGLTTFVKDDDKLYGIPIKHLIPLVSVYYIYSFGESNLTGILKKEDFISAVSAITAVTKYSDFKPENFESNGNVLKGTMFKDGDIVGKNLTTVEVKGGVPLSSLTYKITAGRGFDSNGYKTYEVVAKDILRESVKSLSAIKETYEGKGKKDDFKNLREGNTKSSSAIAKGVIANASQILKQVTGNVGNLMNAIIRVDNACISLPFIMACIYRANYVHIMWDRACYAKSFLESQLKNNAELKKSIEDKGKKVETLESDVKQIFTSFNAKLVLALGKKMNN